MKPITPEKLLQVKLPLPLLLRLRAAAALDDSSVKDMVRVAVSVYLEEHFPDPRRVRRPAR